MNARSLAQEATSWYLAHLDPCAPNEDNVKRYLRGPVLNLTLKVLNSPDVPSAGLEIESDSVYQEEKKSAADEPVSESPWRKFLHRSQDDNWNEQDQDAYDTLGHRTKARLEAFLASCSLALPDMSISMGRREDSKNKLAKKPAPNTDVSLTEALAGYRVSKDNTISSPKLSSIQASTTLLRQLSASSASSSMPLPQFRASDLSTRLELYIRTIARVRTLGRECVVAAEPPRALRARANALVMSFVATVGCVRSMGPSLTRLLQCLTKELLAEDVLGVDLCNAIRQLALEYEHQTSFASLAFLSSPEVSAQTNLTPMIISYLSYLQKNWENLEADCKLECMLSTVIDTHMRTMFKTIEFTSLGHLLEVCQGFRRELNSIELPPGMGGISADDVTALCSDLKAVKQAIRDLQREVLTVNGHVLPPVDSRKELVQLMSQTLNSRTLTASYGKRKLKQSLAAAVHRSESCPVIIYKENADPKSEDSDDFMSSENEASGNEADNDESLTPNSTEPLSRARKSRRRASFHLGTVDMMTRRLLIASSRTGKGGDAYFIVRDLFGGDDVEVVPSASLPTYGRMAKAGTIEILVRLASVTIKVHGSFDVYPKSLVGECEPLIQLHTTTTEVISLQEVRAGDSDDIGSNHSGDSDGGRHVIREMKTDKTGWRTLTIRPAIYEKVEVWNTPS